MELSICLVAGEPSGDLLGAGLAQALKGLWPGELKLWGSCGPSMEAAGVAPKQTLEQHGFMGFFEVIKNLPDIRYALRAMADEVMSDNPDVVVLIDYPGFNLRLAKTLRCRGYSGKIVQLVCPSIWAHSRKRLKTMERTLDLVLCILPFETELFESSSLDAIYIGNPVAERIMNCTAPPLPCLAELAYKHPLIGLFPGSRPREIERHLPVMLEAARLIQSQMPDARFVMSCAHRVIHKMMHAIAQQRDPLRIGDTLYLIDHQHNRSVMRMLRAAIAKSGTVTLELALHTVPTVVVYQIGFVSALIARVILGLKLEYYSLVNIIRGKEVFPELIFRDFDPHLISQELIALATESNARKICLEECLELQSDLSHPKHPSTRAAQAILDLLPGRPPN